MVRYTLGVYLDIEKSRVALILKNRPKWQEGLFNFPGGHIEEGESPKECIAREFKEECGITTLFSAWKIVGVMQGKDWELTILGSIHKSTEELRTMEDQYVTWVDWNSLPDNCISNVYWIIPLVFDFMLNGGIKSFNVYYE